MSDDAPGDQISAAESPTLEAWRPFGWRPHWILPAVLMVVVVALVLAPRFMEAPLRSDNAGPGRLIESTEIGPVLELQARVLAASVLAPTPAASLQAAAGIQEIKDTQSLTDRQILAMALVEGFLRPGAEARAALVLSLEDSPDPLAEEVRSVLTESGALGAEAQSEFGWFARLWDVGLLQADDPAREDFLTRGGGMMIFLSFLSLLLIALVLAGFVLGIMTVSRWYAGKISLRLGPTGVDATHGRGAGWIYFEAFAVFLVVWASSGFIADLLGLGEAERSTDSPTGVSPVITVAFFLAPFVAALFWPSIRGVRWKTMTSDVGLHRGRGVVREMAAGIVGYVALLPLLLLGVTVTLLLAQFWLSTNEGASMDDLPTNPIQGFFEGTSTGTKMIAVFLAAVCAPVVEETVFRGFLYRAFRGRWKILSSASIVAIIFAVIHPQTLIAVPTLVMIAISFALLREWRGSLIAPMTAHGLHNGFLVMVAWIVFGSLDGTAPEDAPDSEWDRPSVPATAILDSVEWPLRDFPDW